MVKFEKEIEEQYRSYYHKNDSLLFLAAIFIVVLLALVFSIFDLTYFERGENLYYVIAARAVLIGVCAISWIVFRKRLLKNVNWNYAIAIASLLMALNYFEIAGERAQYYQPFYEHSAFTVTSLLYLVVYFFLVPIYNPLLKLIPGVVMVVITLMRIDINELRGEAGLAAAVSLIVISAICAFVSWRVNDHRRQIFGQFLQEKIIRGKLEESLKFEALLHQTEQSMLRKEAELKLLSAQIKPHFLYNVIGTAAVLSRMNANLAGLMLDKLALYLRGSLNVTRDFVTLGEELSVVEAYLQIQKIRMDERMNFVINYDSALKDVLLPVFAVQTLVENAVLHGLKDCDGGGEIIINTQLAENDVEISVQDNGRGITAEEISAVYCDEERTEPLQCGIGLWNVNRRLRLMGSDGLVFKTGSCGTNVSFVLRGKDQC